MILLDAFMDALSSLFPDLTRTLPSRGGSELRAPGKGGDEDGSAETGFAAALLQLLGRGAAPELQPPASPAPAASNGTADGGSGASLSNAVVGEGAGGVASELLAAPTERGVDGAEPGGEPGEWMGVGFQGEPGGESPGWGRGILGGRPREMGEATLGAGPSERGDAAPRIDSRETAETEPLDSDQRVRARERLVGFPDDTAVRSVMSGDSGGIGDSAEPASPSITHLPAPPAGAAAASAPDRDVEKLQPELRERLDRVVARMESEYGHRVEVVESYRPPERQEALFRQGRTEPGPVVTWTRDSLHTQGRAVDVRVDGSWEDHEGYARLQEVAREEGLRTLGARDPGHLELPGDGPDGEPFSAREARRPAVSGPARPARVANPATVARVARVARPGWSEAPTRTAADASTPSPSGAGRVGLPGEAAPRPASVGAAGERTLPPTGMDGTPPFGGEEATRRAGAAHRDAASSPPPVAAGLPDLATLPEVARVRREGGGAWGRRESSSAVDAPSDLHASDATLSGASGTPELPPLGGVSSAAPLQPVATMERIDRIQALEDALDMRLPGRIHVELEDVDGAGTRLRLALRGTQLDGSIGLSDPEAALRMRARIGELHEALSRRGLDARALDLQTASGTSTRMEADSLAALRDPVAALARMGESREGSSDSRTDRGWTQQREEGGREARDHRGSARRDRSKEENR